MNAIERRGRTIFWVLFGLLAADCLLRVVAAIAFAQGPIHWWSSVAMRFATPVVVLCACSGDKTFKWMAVVCLALDAVNWLMPGLFIAYKLAERTPWDQMGFLLWVLSFTVGEMLIRGAFFVAMALAFAFLPSLQAFWRFQREGPELPEELRATK
jgi:hypothetical protein